MALFDFGTTPITPPPGAASPGLLAQLLGATPGGATGLLNPENPGASTPLSSPAQDQQQLAMAQALQREGSSYAPIQSPWQGLDRLAQGLVGGYEAGQVQKNQQAGDAAWRKSLAAYLSPQAPAPATPQTAALGTALSGGASAPAPAASTPIAAPQPAASSTPNLGMTGAPTFAAGVGTPTGASPNAQTALSFYESKGLSPIAAAGLVGGFTQESGKGLNTNALAVGDGNDGSNAIGIGQWNGQRAQALRQFAAANGLDPSNINTQLQFSWNELNGPEKGALSALQEAQTPTQATAAALGYERPAGWSPQNPLGANTAPQRLAATNALAGGGVGGSPMPLRTPSVFGGLDPNAFGPQGSGALPLMAASGMGSQLAPQVGFGPIGTGTTSPQPAALAYAPQPALAPAQQAISGAGLPQPDTTMRPGFVAGFGPNGNGSVPAMVPATAAGSPATDPGTASNHTITGANPTPPAGTPAQPYGSVPVNIGGRLLTRQQAHDAGPVGDLDGEDAYDNAAEDAGLIPDASKAPAFVSQGASAGSPTAATASPVASGGSAQPASLAGFKSLDGSPIGQAKAPMIDKAALLGLMTNPYTPASVQQMAVTMLEQASKQEAWQTLKDGDGSVWQRNALTGEMKVIQDNSGADDKWSVVKGPGDVPLYEFNSSTGKTQPLSVGSGNAPAGWRAATVAEKQQYGVEPNAPLMMSPAGEPKLLGAGQSITVNAGADNVAYDKQLADALGKSHAALATGVEDAQARARDLNAMQGALDAIQRNGGTTGFGQTQLLQLKSAVNSGANAIGIDQPFDISDPEFLTKFNRQIAGAQAKGAVGSRVTNFEMANYLKSNPGLEMSPTGNRRLLGIQSQIEQRNIAVGNGIRDATAQAIAAGRKIDPVQVQGIISGYDQAHHIVDPVTGQDLTQSPALPEFQGNATPGQAQPVASAGPNNPTAILGEARAALARGAPRAAVVQRLRSMNIDPGAL